MCLYFYHKAWSKLGKPWLRLISCNNKSHDFCSWIWKSLRNSHSRDVICGLWGLNIPWHVLPSCSFDCLIRNLIRAFKSTAQVSVRKNIQVSLIPEDQGVHQDSQAGKDTACISCYLKKYLNVLQFVT